MVSRVLIPNYGWRKSSLPTKLPFFWQEVVEDLKKKSSSQREYLHNAYSYIATHYTGGRFKTILYLPLVFQDPLSHKSGYIQCNVQNYLLRVLLVKGGWFGENDVQVKTTILNFFTHQYLKVKVGEKWIDVDPHESYKGVPLGKHSQWFR
jgi:hypothetical protein